MWSLGQLLYPILSSKYVFQISYFDDILKVTTYLMLMIRSDPLPSFISPHLTAGHNKPRQGWYHPVVQLRINQTLTEATVPSDCYRGGGVVVVVLMWLRYPRYGWKFGYCFPNLLNILVPGVGADDPGTIWLIDLNGEA